MQLLKIKRQTKSKNQNYQLILLMNFWKMLIILINKRKMMTFIDYIIQVIIMIIIDFLI